jgi:Protein of unknown function (DUF1488)
MPLDRGEYLGSDRTTHVCRFNMRLQEKLIPFLVSYEALDDLGRKARVKEQDREKLFEALRGAIEEKAERKFFSFNDDTRPEEILLTTKDFLS